MTNSNLNGSKINVNIGGDKIEIIQGIITAYPPKGDLQISNDLYNRFSPTLKANFDIAKANFVKRATWFIQQVKPELLVQLKHHFFEVYLTPSDSTTIARVTFHSDGRAWISIDVDDVQKNTVETLVHFMMHEFIHMLSFYQYYSTQNEDISGRFSVENSYLICGVAVHQSTSYTVTGMTANDWQSAGQALLSIQQQKTGTKAKGDVTCTKKANDFIYMLQHIYPTDYALKGMEHIVDWQSKLNTLKTVSITSKKDFLVNTNEILTEFTARLAGLENLLKPSSSEIQFFNEKGGYTNLVGLRHFFTFYKGLTEENRLEFVQTLLECQIAGDQSILTQYLNSNQSMIKKRYSIDSTEFANSDFAELALTNGLFNTFVGML